MLPLRILATVKEIGEESSSFAVNTGVKHVHSPYPSLPHRDMIRRAELPSLHSRTRNYHLAVQQ